MAVIIAVLKCGHVRRVWSHVEAFSHDMFLGFVLVTLGSWMQLSTFLCPSSQAFQIDWSSTLDNPSL